MVWRDVKGIAENIHDKVWMLGVHLERLRGMEGDAYTRKVYAIHRRLGIPSSYGSRGLTLFTEAGVLVPVKSDFSGGGYTV